MILPITAILLKSVTKSFTVRTVCMDMWLVFVLPSTPILARSVTKNFTVSTVCRDVRPMFHYNIRDVRQMLLKYITQM